MYTYNYEWTKDDGRFIKSIDNSIQNVDLSGVLLNASCGEFDRIRVKELYVDNYYFDETSSNTLTDEIDKLKTEIYKLKTQVRDQISVDLYGLLSRIDDIVGGIESADKHKSAVVADPYGKVR